MEAAIISIPPERSPRTGFSQTYGSPFAAAMLGCVMVTSVLI